MSTAGALETQAVREDSQRLRYRAWGLAALSGATFALLITFQTTLAASPRGASAAAVAVGTLSVVVTISARSSGLVSVGSVYAMLLFLWHLGLLTFTALALPIHFFNAEDQSWFDSPALAPAAMSVAIGSIAFAFAYVSAVGLFGGRSGKAKEETDSQASDPVSGLVGIGLLTAGVALFLWASQASGAALLGSTYEAFLHATLPLAGQISTSYLLIGYGAAVTASSRRRSLRIIGLSIFAAFAIVAIPIGLRGEVMLPGAAWAVVAARRRKIRARWIYPILLLGALSLGSVVRQFRSGGFSLRALSHLSITPIDGLVEAGYSIRPVMLVHSWHDFYAEPFLGLGSYLHPFDRLVRGRILGIAVTSPQEDPRAFLSVVAHRAGQIGGSSIAEGYYFAGTLGVVVALCVLGLVAAWLDRLPSTPMFDGLVGMVSVILFLSLRNDQTALAGQLLVAFAALAMIRASQFVRTLKQHFRDRRPTRTVKNDRVSALVTAASDGVSGMRGRRD